MGNKAPSPTPCLYRGDIVLTNLNRRYTVWQEYTGDIGCCSSITTAVHLKELFTDKVNTLARKHYFVRRNGRFEYAYSEDYYREKYTDSMGYNRYKTAEYRDRCIRSSHEGEYILTNGVPEPETVSEGIPILSPPPSYTSEGQGDAGQQPGTPSAPPLHDVSLNN